MFSIEVVTDGVDNIAGVFVYDSEDTTRYILSLVPINTNRLINLSFASSFWSAFQAAISYSPLSILMICDKDTLNPILPGHNDPPSIRIRFSLNGHDLHRVLVDFATDMKTDECSTIMEHQWSDIKSFINKAIDLK